MSSAPTDGLSGMEATTFRATVELAGKTATGVRVPAEVVEALGSGKQPLVHVTIEDHRYRSKVAVRGGEYKLPISAENRAGAGIEAGDEVTVTLALDTDPREVALPADLDAALSAEARRVFDGLSNSRKGWFVDNVESAKTAETRERRVAKAVERLAAGG
jgi:Domain of unknown function (DUF1905)/Bacteriocin-protection, YdeI or OmpD-Associated